MKLIITYEGITKEQSKAIQKAINILENNGTIDIDDSAYFEEEEE